MIETYSTSNIVDTTTSFVCGQIVERHWSIHFVMHVNVKSLCSSPETNIKFYVDYISIKKSNGQFVTQNSETILKDMN